MHLTSPEWESWKQEPATKVWFEFLKKLIAVSKEEWTLGHFTSERGDATLQLNAEAIGRVNALKRLLDVDYEDLVEELSDGE